MTYLFHKFVKGKKYYYLGQNKSVNGKSRRNLEIYLGSANTLKKYLEKDSLPKEVESVSYGLPSALLTLNTEIDFVNTVDRFCPKRNHGLSVGDHILIDIINRLDDPCSHNKLGSWFSKTILRNIFSVKPSYLSSQGYWNHWQYLTGNRIEQIQEELLKILVKRVDVKQLFYDPTNFTTFIADSHKDNPKGNNRHKVSIAKYGKSKSGLRGLKQINLALLVTKDYGIPLWHKPYDGNINDVTFFKTFIESMKSKIGIFVKECKSITLVFDKGNNSSTNLKSIDKDLHFYMLGSLTPSEHKDWLKISLNNFDLEYTTAKDEKVKAHHFRAEVFGKDCSIVITYNKRTAFKQKTRTERKLNKALDYLKEAEKKLNKPKWNDYEKVLLRINSNIVQFHANKIVKWNLKKNKKKLIMDFCKNKAEMDYLESSYGKTILFTDNDSLKPVEIIKAYHDKHILEQKIRLLKNRHIVSFTPQYCWTDDSIRAHSFTCVMALLLFTLLKKKVLGAGIKLSDEDIVEKLKEIRQGLLLMPKIKKVIPMIEKMGTIHKKLYSLLNLEKIQQLVTIR